MNHGKVVVLEIFFLCLALASGCMLGWNMFGPDSNPLLLGISGILFTCFLLITVALMLDPEHIRARQSMSVLNVATQTLEAIQGGLNFESAQRVCELLYSACSASAVAITDREVVIGYCGEGREQLGNLGNPIRTQATMSTIKDGQTRVLRERAEVGLPKDASSSIRGAIIVPLRMGNEIYGTLKFYYTKPRRMQENQISIAEGFGQLLSTQIAAMELEEQKKLAASMELKALQSQINPHFLFNIINTIASLIRTDPDKARVMLREFAAFYRSTLENSSDLIPVAREIEQTVRYLKLEQARFGEERLAVTVDVPDDIQALQVPSFMIQPIVENSVKHAMPAEGKLTISIAGDIEGDDVSLYINDDGIGMSEEALNSIMNPNSSTGLGIAVKNVNDRIRGYYGPGSYMHIESELGKGTKVTLFLKDCARV